MPRVGRVSDPPFDYGVSRSALCLLTPITASSGIEHRANSFGVPISGADSQNRALRISSLLGSALRFVSKLVHLSSD